MIKRFLFAIFFTSFTIGIAQTYTNGVVTYSVDMDEYIERMESDNESRPSDNLMVNTANQIKKFKVQLEFDGYRGIFKVPQSLSLDGRNELDNLVKSFISNGIYYSDLKENLQIWATESDGKKINVLKERKENKWELQNEKKKIGDFICHKAVFLREVNGKSQEIIAWYAPEIPLQLGPKEYFGNLPGLILELKEPLLTYKCSNIKFGESKIDKWPMFKNIITETDYQNLMKKTWGALFQNK